MSVPQCVLYFVLLLQLVFGGAAAWLERGSRRGVHRAVSYPRDWDWDWQSDPVPDYHYLRPRMEVVPEPPQDTRGVIHSQQRGSALVPYPGATVRVRPQAHHGHPHKFYRGVITSTVSDGPTTRGQRHPGTGRTRNVDGGVEVSPQPQYWQYSQDEAAPPKVCARCPGDRAVLAKRGADHVIMEAPPIVPCNARSSVKKVKQEVVFGPQPGDRLSEGSHKIAVRLYRHRRTLATCVTRYNVIVRKCGELEVGPGVLTDCPLGKAWGGHCNISCDPGYQLEGDAVVRCTDDLEWSGDVPRCVPTTACPAPIAPDHGQLSCRTPRHRPVLPRGMLPDGSRCHYLCDPGYSIPLAQHHLADIRCVAGSWDSPQDPVCVETNELVEEEPQRDITPEEALRFDGVGCPEGFCRNGGRCIVILDDPMCSCRTGYYGANCEHGEDDDEDEGDPEESNVIS